MVGQGELTRISLVESTCESPFFIPEQFAFDQVAGNGGAVDRHERPFGPLAFVMDGLGKKFLARPAFALDQDDAVVTGILLCQGNGLQHGRVPRQDIIEGILGPVAHIMVRVGDHLLLVADAHGIIPGMVLEGCDVHAAVIFAAPEHDPRIVHGSAAVLCLEPDLGPVDVRRHLAEILADEFRPRLPVQAEEIPHGLIDQQDAEIMVQEQRALQAAVKCFLQQPRHLVVLQHRFDTESRRHDKAQGMGIFLVIVRTGQVDAADDFPVGTVDGRRRTGPAVLGDAVVFRAHRLDGRIVVQCDADGVAADLDVAPQRFFPEIQFILHLFRQRNAECLQHIADTVREDKEKLALVDDLIDTLHDGHGRLDEVPVLIPDALEDAVVHQFALAAVNIGPRVAALDPGFADDRVQSRIDRPRPDERIPVALVTGIFFLNGLCFPPHVQSTSILSRNRTSFAAFSVFRSLLFS